MITRIVFVAECRSLKDGAPSTIGRTLRRLLAGSKHTYTDLYSGWIKC